MTLQPPGISLLLPSPKDGNPPTQGNASSHSLDAALCLSKFFSWCGLSDPPEMRPRGLLAAVVLGQSRISSIITAATCADVGVIS